MIEGLKQCRASIHLLNEKAGALIDDAEEESYPQRQIALAIEHVNSPFVWLPKTLVAADIASPRHERFLSELRNNTVSRPRLIQGLDKEPDYIDIYDQVVDCLRAGMKGEVIRPDECLVDFHAHESPFHYCKLANFLGERGLRVRLVPESPDTLEKGRSIFEACIHQVAAVFILFGMVNEAWIDERLKVARQCFAVESGRSPHFIVCVFPPEKNGDALERFAKDSSDLVPVHTMDFTRGFALDKLVELLNGLGLGGAS